MCLMIGQNNILESLIISAFDGNTVRLVAQLLSNARSRRIANFFLGTGAIIRSFRSGMPSLRASSGKSTG